MNRGTPASMGLPVACLGRRAKRGCASSSAQVGRVHGCTSPRAATRASPRTFIIHRQAPKNPEADETASTRDLRETHPADHSQTSVGPRLSATTIMDREQAPGWGLIDEIRGSPRRRPVRDETLRDVLTCFRHRPGQPRGFDISSVNNLGALRVFLAPLRGTTSRRRGGSPGRVWGRGGAGPPPGLGPERPREGYDIGELIRRATRTQTTLYRSFLRQGQHEGAQAESPDRPVVHLARRIRRVVQSTYPGRRPQSAGLKITTVCRAHSNYLATRTDSDDFTLIAPRLDTPKRRALGPRVTQINSTQPPEHTPANPSSETGQIQHTADRPHRVAARRCWRRRGRGGGGGGRGAHPGCALHHGRAPDLYADRGGFYVAPRMSRKHHPQALAGVGIQRRAQRSAGIVYIDEVDKITRKSEQPLDHPRRCRAMGCSRRF